MKITTGSSLVTNKQATTENKNQTALKGLWKEASGLVLAGGLTFWAANFVISRTSIAAEYRAALSISYCLMLLEALIGGLILGLLVGYLLLHFFDKIPAKNPIIKSILISLLVLLVVTISIGNPSTYSQTPDSLRYFIIGTAFNFIRILALGAAIGYRYKRQNIRSNQEVCK